MSEIEKLVPPLEMCKRIPEGEFADSALIWVDRWLIEKLFIDGKEVESICEVIERQVVFHKNKRDMDFHREIFKLYPATVYVRSVWPAPTLQEIMDDLLLGTSDCEPGLFWQGGWHVQCSGKEGYDPKSASVAAMLLWLKINEKGEK